MNVQGKTAVITGSSRGVGRATALALAKRGCAMAINYRRSKDEAEKTAADVRALGVKALCIQADVSDEAACRNLVETAANELGGIDILVNNAATTEFLPFTELDRLTDAHWDRLFDVNVKGSFYCVRAAQPFLDQAADGGEIINITSVAGIIGNGSSIAYCASKAALINMTISLARALAPKVRVNAVAPGFIDDDWTQKGLGSNYETVKDRQTQRAVLSKVCLPEDVADAVLGLICGSDMVTGQNIVVDGGMTIGPK